jgi:hypothetical protein
MPKKDKAEKKLKPAPHTPPTIDQAALDNWFTYHAPDNDQQESYLAIREAARQLAEVIVYRTPPSADQSAAIRHVREAVMTANAAIACGGK